MRLLSLELTNFMGHSETKLDLSDLSAALIVGQKVGNELVANAVGKSTLLKAIEYGFFNECGSKLDDLVKDGEEKAQVGIGFSVDSKDYRLTRVRHRKGQTDLSLFVKETDWKDISSRRASDTEKDLAKLLKMNFAAFRNTAHFAQKDMSGLASNTPEKRKAILKEGLNLSIYPKLEKIAKEKTSAFEKEIDKKKTVLDGLGNPVELEISLTHSLETNFGLLANVSQFFQEHSKLLQIHKEENQALQRNLDELSKGRDEFLRKDQSLKRQCDQWTQKIATHQSVTKSQNELYAKLLVDLKNSQNELSTIILLDGELLLKDCLDKEVELQKLMSLGERQKIIVEHLSHPLTDEIICSGCRQTVSDEYRQSKQEEINSSLIKEKETYQTLRTSYSSLKTQLNSSKAALEANKANIYKKEILEAKIDSLSNSIKEQEEKLSLRKESETEMVASLIETQGFLKKNEKLIEASDETEILKLKANLNEKTKLISELSAKAREFEVSVSNLKSEVAVLTHRLTKAKEQIAEQKELLASVSSLTSEYEVYQEVTRAFSSTGIPNLIIQNILDDLQAEANNLLSLIKPELSLVFSTEKENSKGEIVDKLEIIYSVDGKERDFSLLSGAQSVAVHFALKLGFSHLLQRMMGVNLEFLLIDEVDESLDKASVDDFASMIKMLAKDVLVLVITHNDRLKDKFSTAIMVEQDMNRSSTASIISW